MREAALMVGAFVFAAAAGAAVGVQFADRGAPGQGEVVIRTVDDPEGTPPAVPTPTVVESTAASPSAVAPKREGKSVTEQRKPEQEPTARQATDAPGTGTVDVIKPDPLPDPLPTRAGG
ncbi:hypothetical protein [Micromonospora sp. WMMD1082]|uniref:hypothetical protein n=1 Tax=Micromonospora sp. WMMD1082 TaxID=3016104 RepID=UPI002416CE29|nr:hypothetical protein [Micromonospora sp. WMMD1082]MDG4792430.1 hypothetical protein [Micromonospora sp. WMMD1082]